MCAADGVLIILPAALIVSRCTRSACVGCSSFSYCCASHCVHGWCALAYVSSSWLGHAGHL